MPDEILSLKRLIILVLAFNKFYQIPSSVAQLTDVRNSECETIIMSGNLIDSIPSDTLARLKHAKKVCMSFFCMHINYYLHKLRLLDTKISIKNKEI